MLPNHVLQSITKKHFLQDVDPDHNIFTLRLQRSIVSTSFRTAYLSMRATTVISDTGSECNNFSHSAFPLGWER